MTVDEIQNGQVFLVDKPIDWTSFQAVNKMKFKLKREFKLKKIKIGHAGTLDPKATGLLIICTGKATKQIPEIQNASKEYETEIKIGVQTASYDTEQPEILHQDIHHITEEKIHEVLSKFIGEIQQKPPLFSAIKINGKRAYHLARAGEEIEIKSRSTTIYNIGNIEINFPFIRFKVRCSKGTYIRSLAHDIGQALGVGAYLTQLKRTQIGNYTITHGSSIFLSDDFYFSDL